MQNNLYCICLLICTLSVQAQSQRKIAAQLQWTGKDSVVHTIKQKEGTLAANLSTGEIKLNVPLKAFAKSDSLFSSYIAPYRLTDMELFFVLEGDAFAFHAGGNQSTITTSGMLHINSHFHPVKVKCTIFRKSVQSDLTDFTYLMSIRFVVDPAHYELNTLTQNILTPFVFQLYKQPYTFLHNR
jgi:hypothetical protein